MKTIKSTSAFILWLCFSLIKIYGQSYCIPSSTYGPQYGTYIDGVVLNEISNKVADLFTKRKRVKVLLKSLNKEITSLSKKKSKAIRRELKNINQEGIDKIKEINHKVKILKKELKEFKANEFAESWKTWSLYQPKTNKNS